MNESRHLSVGIMIATRNREADLARTLDVIARLNPPPDEILITADGCTDGTISLVRTRAPSARLIVNETARGSVASRDHMLREATTDLVLALDDDSYPEQPDCLATLQTLFATRPQMAVAHFPQRSDEYPETLKNLAPRPERLTNWFPNSGACYRRSVYLEVPGFYLPFFHMFEEPDYALQCYAAGYEVRSIPVLTVRHHFSSHTRSEIRNHHRHARNEWWSVWLRCPWPYALAMLVYRPFTELRYALRRGPAWVIREPVWWWEALRGVPHCLRNRRPIIWARYKQWLRPGNVTHSNQGRA